MLKMFWKSVLISPAIIGAALAVIIPEGIQMLYTQQFHGIKPALLKNYNYLK